jgi:hypothetical protein
MKVAWFMHSVQSNFWCDKHVGTLWSNVVFEVRFSDSVTLQAN